MKNLHIVVVIICSFFIQINSGKFRRSSTQIFPFPFRLGKIKREVKDSQTYSMENSTHKIVYYYEARFTRYDENERRCNEKGMTLAFVRSAEENNFIKNFRKDMVRLGAVKDPFSRKYEWADGSEITYTNWSRDNYFYQGCCSVEMDDSGRWRKYRGDSSHLLCQKIINKSDPNYNQTIENEIKNPTFEEEINSTENSMDKSPDKPVNITEENEIIPMKKIPKDAYVSERQAALAIEFTQRAISEMLAQIYNQTINNITRLSKDFDQKLIDQTTLINTSVRQEMNESTNQLFNELSKNLSFDLNQKLDKKIDLFQNESAYKWSEMISKNAIIVSRGIESKVNSKLDGVSKEINDKNDRLMLSFKNDINVVENEIKNLTQRFHQLITTTQTLYLKPTPMSVPKDDTAMVKLSKNLSISSSDIGVRNSISEKWSETDSHAFLSDQVKTSPSIATSKSAIHGSEGIYIILISLIMIATILIVYKKFLKNRMFKRLNESEDGMIILE